MSEPFKHPINAGTRFCAVYGYPVRHSASPAMQNAGLAALGLNWRYLAFEVHPERLREAIDGARVMGFIGLNLTVPHKLLAADLVDALDESAASYGAVNTIRFECRAADGRWVPIGAAAESSGEIRAQGFNTDADAISRALRDDLGIQLAGAKVLLLGTGGAGRTAALKLAAEGVSQLFLVNRTVSKASELAEEIAERWPEVKVLLEYPQGRIDLAVNATSLGLRPEDPLPFDEKRLTLEKVGALYEMIYRPPETSLLTRARKAGCRTANGLGMLLYQGAKALELWTGQPAPLEVMRRALEENVYASHDLRRA